MRKKHPQVPVTRRALFQRVNRALAKKGERLRTYRAGRSLGKLFIVDVNRARIVREHCDLEEIGRELGALEPFERLDEEGT